MTRVIRPFISAAKFARSYLRVSKHYLTEYRIAVVGLVLLSAMGGSFTGGPDSNGQLHG